MQQLYTIGIILPPLHEMFVELSIKQGIFQPKTIRKLFNVHSISSMDVYSNMVILHIQKHGEYFNSNSYCIETVNITQSYDIVNEITKYAAKAPPSRRDVLRLDLMC